MIRRIYEWILLRGIEVLPGHICFMITASDLQASPGKLTEVELVPVYLLQNGR